LPYSSCLVSHGGIGTCAQALKAGVPHIVMPFAFDQFDNASRLMKLGVGYSVNKDGYKAAIVSEKLTKLLNSGTVKKNCQSIKKKFYNANGVSDSCDAIINNLY